MSRFYGNYRAKVLGTDKDEDEQLGRIKVEVYPMLIGEDTARELSKQQNVSIDGISLDTLPWAVPAYPLSLGAHEWTDENGDKVQIGSFNVPEIDSYVWVFFEAGDIYQPVYFAEAPTGKVGLPDRRVGPEEDDDEKNHYPDRKVIRFKRGVIIFDDHAVTDSQSDEEAVETYSGDEGEGGGELIIRVKKDIHLIAEDSHTIETGNIVSIKTRNKLIVVSDNNIEIHTDVDLVVDVDGNVNLTVDGDIDANATGDVNVSGSTVNLN